MNDQPNTDPQPAPEGEPLLNEQYRSAGQVAAQAADAAVKG